MPGKNQQNQLVIREIEYTIRMKDNDTGFHELRDLLRSELTRFEDSRKRTLQPENVIRGFLQANIERSVAVREHTKVYFTNYKEKDGPFIIQFAVLVITLSDDYGAVRHILDHLIKDTVGEYFEELLERHLPVTVNVQWDEQTPLQLPAMAPGSETAPAKPHRDLLPVVLAAVATGLSVLAIGLLIFLKPAPKPAISPYEELQQKYNELLIEKKVNEALQQREISVTVNHSADSAIQAAPAVQPRRALQPGQR